MATQALMGTVLRVLKEESGWFLVQTPDDYLGWLDKGAFTLLNEAGINVWGNSKKLIVLAEFARVYAEPSLSVADSTEVVSDLVYGNVLINKGLAKNNDQMRQVELPDGRTGFVIRRNVTNYENWLNAATTTGEKYCGYRPSFLWAFPIFGVVLPLKVLIVLASPKRYIWDRAFNSNAMLLLQVHTGIEVDTDTTTWRNLQPGDLLFFGRKATAEKKERISHVAIWMGNGQIIHAAELVKIESLVRGEKDLRNTE